MAKALPRSTTVNKKRRSWYASERTTAPVHIMNKNPGLVFILASLAAEYRQYDLPVLAKNWLILVPELRTQ